MGSSQPGTGVPDAIDDATLVNNSACATDSPTRLTAPERQSAAASEIVSFLVAPGASPNHMD
ncbi:MULTISPECIES: hypothetical protein [Microbacterium]|uniref:hypothetical protein n=1 Tax=Microbacterium TaxID=33882 RepID=UPI0010F6F704|nr:hypothetical protein [Microbacterium sp. 4NA327F11]MCK9920147.1 hypothetical protein [Microbacteriaceae bacterium K1510]